MANEMTPEEVRRIEAEAAKLQAEADALRSSGWNKPSTWLPMLAAIAAIGTSIGQWQYSTFEQRKAELDARERKLDIEEEEKRLQQRNKELEAIRASLLEDIKISTSEIQELKANLQEGNAKLLSIAEATDDRELQSSIKESVQAQNKEAARIAENAEKRRADAQLNNLVWQVNDAVKSNRLVAVERLIREHRSSPQAIDLALDLLRPPRLDELSPSGRINLLVFLRNTDLAVWPEEMKVKALQTIDLYREAARSQGVTIGPQTEDAIRQFIERLAAS